MNLMTLINRLLAGGSKGMPRLVGAVLLALVLGYSFLTGQVPGEAPQAGGQVTAQRASTGGGAQASSATGEGAARTAQPPGAASADAPPAGARGGDRADAGRSSLSGATAGPGEILVSQLPREAQATLTLILKGGPYPYEKDGTVFGNREGLLPKQRRGYYTEYTVRTPNVNHRGARRIVAGGAAGRLVEFYYTDDHYQSFKRIKGVDAAD